MMIKKMPFQAPPPKDLIGPRINHSARLLRHRFNKVINDAGLFSGQQHIILLLHENEGLTVSQISSFLEITPATVSVSVKRMEKAGFICRKADEKDARLTKLYLTEKGEAVLQSIKDKMDAQEEVIVKGLTKQEREMLSDLLEKVIHNLEEKEMSENA